LIARLRPHNPAGGIAKRRPQLPPLPALVAFRADWREREPSGSTRRCPRSGRSTRGLLIVGLAPGLRGANRTGRPFTGDFRRRSALRHHEGNTVTPAAPYEARA
jgi:uracil-DNA glycosylase